MTTHRPQETRSCRNAPSLSEPKELYRAPQLKIHGKLERITLTASNSNSGNTPGGGNDLPEG